MLLPGDPILYVFAIIGVAIYAALKSGPEKKKDEVSHEEFMKMYRQMKEDRKEMNRYSKWLYDHRPKE